MSDDNNVVRRKQWAVFAAIGGLAAALFFFVYMLVTEVGSKRSPQQTAPQSIQLAGAGRAAGADTAWWKAADDHLRKLEKRQDDLASQLATKAAPPDNSSDELQRRMGALEGEFKQVIDKYAAANEKLEAEIARLRAAQDRDNLASIGRGRTIPGQPGYGDLAAGANVFGNAGERRRAAETLTGDIGAGGSGNQSTRGKPAIVNIKLTTREAPNQASRAHNPKLYVAAGSYAPVRIISGADVTAGVTDQSDPKPMLARVLGPARGVIDKGRVRTTELRGCLVTLEGRADLPSERVYGRPVRMSCPADGGTVRELKVKGYLVDRGTAGIRGVVTERTGDLVGRAAMAGLVGGLGSTVNNALNPALGGFSISTGDDRSTGKKLKEAGLGGLGGGAQSAGDRLGDYYIDRLEQIQPVISAVSGAELELVFLEGFYLDGRPSGDSEEASLPDLTAVTANLPGIPPTVLNGINGAQKK
ncbi:TrbI/VirB10 family protein [Asticcacaulis sp.]|uniref:TrbI/VirB10 family protein n=1 Tax=Asticcacaulis sp. TaxID=1872648 RepID=UPI00260E89F6|nr:TrbI/VirB10 family protein [Asticcacaulis sp.]